MDTEKKKIVVSGIRPTGKLHLGNYWGALKNWVELQEKYDCWFFIADWHALTTGHEKSEEFRSLTREIVLDWLAAGLDPARCVMFRQSDIKSHAELSLLLGMITPVSWLLRNPTFKEQLQELYKQKYKGQEDKMKKAEGVTRQLAEAHGHDCDELALQSDMATYGFLGYPVLQAADILMYGAHYVPVGKDQLPHLELTREIARRFNHVFGGELLRAPEPLLTPAPVVPGLDGRKMSKSYGNTIEMGEDPKSVEAKINKMFTDPTKIHKDDEGHPDGCVVAAFHRLYNPDWPSEVVCETTGSAEDVLEMNICIQEVSCKRGTIGCGACKKHLFKLMSKPLAQFRERRAAYEGDAARVETILAEGGQKAGAAASALMVRLNRTVKLA
ncbi:MAG: tryptophan--tRNA ligase [Elusimicrobia bacterium]|nr:tryptophan--tRNA ligase [Elusimicrobiota bacterium]